MNTHNIELPPLPDLPVYSSEVFDREVRVVSETMAEQLMHDYARAAIEPYQRRIAELESQLEAIGAGGVSSQRITSQRRGEPVARFKCGHAKHGGECVNVAPQPADPVVKDSLTVPEGWQLVPKELIDFLDAKEHHLPVEDRHVLSIMLAAAPEPPCTL